MFWGSARKEMVKMEEFGEFPQLETDRLILREMTLDDVEFYFRHFNNDKVVEGCCFPGPISLKLCARI